MSAAADIAMIVAFALCALIAVGGALGMATTMSMFRSGIFLMASFIGVGGLFILLAADLMALLQIMMYIGGMLVMILFMVMFMHDPGGAMMAAMPDMMSPVERLFSSGLQQQQQQAGAGHPHDHAHHGMDHCDMDMNDMSMVTPARRAAAWLAAAIGIGLALLLLLRPVWHVSAVPPDPRSAELVGNLLMGKYMVAFEGCGLLILLGIFGAVLLAHVGHPSRDVGRSARVAKTDPPPPIAPDLLEPSPANQLLPSRDDGDGA